MLSRVLRTIAFACCLLPVAAWGGKLKPLATVAPEGGQLAFQLTDGTVLVQSFQDQHWYKLVPDLTGSYLRGTWTRVADLPSKYSPDAYASAVLADGRVVISGGEYDFGNFALTKQSAIYDPQADKWTMLHLPDKMRHVGDSPSVVLPDGRYVIGTKLNKAMFAMDPATLTWTELNSTGKNDFHSEEGWTLLPDGRFLAVDVKDSPKAEIYSPVAQAWTSARDTLVDLKEPPCCDCTPYPPNNRCYYPPGEIGPAILRPDGTVFATGGFPQGGLRGHTAIYNPATNRWTAGPDFPSEDAAGDSFAALLTSGNVLVEGETGRLYEFDGTNLTYQGVGGGGNSLMILPTGEVLVGGRALYSSKGGYKASWAPTITNAPSTVSRGTT
ncbi:MAG TPA: hypothetical protein VGM17_18995, partial [Rhizomicrobium sp.]